MTDAPFDVNIVPEVHGQLVQTARDGGQPPADPGKAAQTKLEAVLEISQALAAAKAVEDILPQVLNTLMARIFPIADRGSIMLLDPQTGQMIPTAQQHKHESEDHTVRLSRTVLELVLKEKKGVRSMDAGMDDRFQTSESIALHEIHSMMCVPLLSLEGEAIGIIHVDSHSTFAQFNDQDMDLLVSIAGQAALAYDSARQLQQREQLRTEMEVARHRALSQMVSGLAHELNTPLGIINSAASVIGDTAKELSDRELPEEARDDLEDVAEAVALLQGNLTRANHLITEFKKLSARQLADQRETVSLSELVREVVDAARSQEALAGHELVLHDHLAGGDARWEGFPGHLTQIMLSALDNAGHHAYPGATGKIDVHLSRGEEGAFRLQFVDFGAGIDEGQLEQVFVPFFTTARNRGHRGLGLSIVRTLVHDSLRGTVDIHAAPQKGTMLVVTIPARVPD
jgi:signal transduction histidine kinase